METVKAILIAILIIAFWFIPVILGIRIAKKKNISPHWFWFGIHPFFGWIVFGIVYANKGRKPCPKCLEVLKMHAKVCAYCNHSFDDIENHKPFEEIARNKKKNRNRNIKIGLGIFVTVFSLMLLIITISFTNSWAYKNAFIMAKSNLELKEKIGTPIEQSWPFISGSINKTGNSGRADLGIPIKGSKGQGTLYAKANRSEGTWSMDTLIYVSSEAKDTIWLAPR
jgi:hypothetical protein